MCEGREKSFGKINWIFRFLAFPLSSVSGARRENEIWWNHSQRIEQSSLTITCPNSSGGSRNSTEPPDELLGLFMSRRRMPLLSRFRAPLSPGPLIFYSLPFTEAQLKSVSSLRVDTELFSRSGWACRLPINTDLPDTFLRSGSSKNCSTPRISVSRYVTTLFSAELYDTNDNALIIEWAFMRANYIWAYYVSCAHRAHIVYLFQWLTCELVTEQRPQRCVCTAVSMSGHIFWPEASASMSHSRHIHMTIFSWN